MVDLVEGWFAWAGDNTGKIHVPEEVPMMWRKVEDDHVYSSTRERLFGF